MLRVCLCVYSICVLREKIDFYSNWGSVCVGIAYHAYESEGNSVALSSQPVWTF